MLPYASCTPQQPYGLNYDPFLNVINNIDSIYILLVHANLNSAGNLCQLDWKV